MRVDQPNRVCTEQLRIVARLLEQFVIAVPVGHTVRFVLEMIDLSDQRTIGVIEAALARPIPSVY